MEGEVKEIRIGGKLSKVETHREEEKERGRGQETKRLFSRAHWAGVRGETAKNNLYKHQRPGLRLYSPLPNQSWRAGPAGTHLAPEGRGCLSGNGRIQPDPGLTSVLL